jgi:hypothetical protein
MKRRTINLPTHSQRRRQRAMHALLAGLAWLDAPIGWAAGRTVWLTPAGPFQPNGAELARASYRIERLERAHLPVAQSEKLRRALHEAIYLASLPASDLAILASEARQRNPVALAELVALLPVEAHCIQTMEPSPAALLGASGPTALPALRAMVNNPYAPAGGRTLAALVCGAIERKARREPATHLLPLAYHAAYNLGYNHGLPADVLVIMRLIAAPNGPALAERYCAARAQRSPFQFNNKVARNHLLDGMDQERFVANAEALAAAAPLLDNVIASQEQTPLMPTRKYLRSVAARHRQLSAILIATLPDYVISSGASVIQPFAQVVMRMLAFGPRTVTLIEHIEKTLKLGLLLPLALQQSWLELLISEEEQIWKRADLAEPVSADTLYKWIAQRYNRVVPALQKLLLRCEDLAIVRELLTKGCLQTLSGPPIGRPSRYRSLSNLVQQFPCEPKNAAVVIAGLFRRLPPPRGEQLVAALIDSIRHLEPERRTFLFAGVLGWMWHEPNLEPALTRLTLYMPIFHNLLPETIPDWGKALVPGLLILDAHDPALAMAMLPWLINHFGQIAPENNSAVETSVRFAATIAGDAAGFQALVIASFPHIERRSSKHTDEGMRQMERMPGLQATLRYLAAQQPQRCFNLIAQIGMAKGFGPGALAALAQIEPPPLDRFEQPALVTTAAGWQELLALAPDCASDAAAYLQACWLLGREPALPSGVRQALEHPHTIAKECAFLRKLVSEQPAKRGLQVRLANLQARLADGDQLWAAAASEASDRLRQITAETQLAAAEALLEEIFQRRLLAVAGTLPPGVALSADLRNAVLLLSDIDDNRSLLRRMLRSTVQGEHSWREQLPGNLAFLQELQARGVDPANWLSDAPAIIEHAAIPGGQVRLAFERDPLHILQMGNYFGTCLSLGGGNAFSTVANAVALNKRVLYARDRQGRVVGRKLIAISSEGNLLGFRTYASLAGEAHNALCNVIDGHIRAFAQHCGLTLADSGEVASLLEERWYDDGEIAWESEGQGAKTIA